MRAKHIRTIREGISFQKEISGRWVVHQGKLAPLVHIIVRREIHSLDYWKGYAHNFCIFNGKELM